MMTQEPTPILHDSTTGKFCTPDGAYLLYSRILNILSIDHTFVPDQLRGQNLASRLIKEAVVYSQSIDAKIRPTCPFAQSYLQTKPEFHKALEHPPENKAPSASNSSHNHA